MELTIICRLGIWYVTNRLPSVQPHKNVSIKCNSGDEAIEILQVLNGSPYEEIQHFAKVQNRLSV